MMSNEKNIYKQYFTPKEIAILMIRHIPEIDVDSAIDLAVGDGELLKAVSNRFNNAVLYGADIDSGIIDILKEDRELCNMNLWVGDSLSGDIDKWDQYNNIVNNEKFSLTVGNPPFDYFTQKNFNYEEISKCPIEIGFLLKCINITRDNGYIALILPNGILSNPNNKKIRKVILEKTYVQCVINLYKNSFKEVSADISILILKKKIDNNIQQHVNIKKIDESLKEENIYIYGNEAIDRLDFDFYKNKREINELLCYVPYEMVKLKDIVGTCIRGLTITNRKECVSDKGIPFIHTTNVDNIVIKNKNIKYIDLNYEYMFEKARLKIGDVLVGRVGSNCIKKIGIISNASEEGISSDCLFILRDLKINPYFLALFLRSNLGYMQLQCAKRGSCSKFITRDDVLDILVPIIPNDLQKKFEYKIKKILNEYMLKKDIKIANKKIEKEIKKIEMLVGCNNDKCSIEVCASTY